VEVSFRGTSRSLPRRKAAKYRGRIAELRKVIEFFETTVENSSR
jgi:hypothetical protein